MTKQVFGVESHISSLVMDHFRQKRIFLPTNHLYIIRNDKLMKAIMSLLIAIFFMVHCQPSYHQTDQGPSFSSKEKPLEFLDTLPPSSEEKWKLNARLLSFTLEIEEEIQAYEPGGNLPILTTNLQTKLAQMSSNNNTKGAAGEALQEWMSAFKHILEHMHEVPESEALAQLEASIESFKETFY